jgi:hypothetical protein
MPTCRTEPTRLVKCTGIVPGIAGGQETEICWGFYCEKHLVDFREDVKNFNAKIRSSSTNRANLPPPIYGVSDHQWLAMIASLEVKISATKMTRAVWNKQIDSMGSSMPALRSKSSSSAAEKQQLRELFQCLGKVSVNFSSHKTRIFNYVLLGK